MLGIMHEDITQYDEDSNTYYIINDEEYMNDEDYIKDNIIDENIKNNEEYIKKLANVNPNIEVYRQVY